MNRLLSTLFAATVAIGAITTIAPNEAAACGNSMHRFKETKPVSQVERAWTEIANGRHPLAIAAIAAQFVELDQTADALLKDPKAMASNVERRALHGMALAVVRSEGAWSRTTSPTALTGAGADDNVAWATNVLEYLAKNHAAARVHYAEALALDELKRPAARLALEKLAKSGSVTEPATWAVIAELRAEVGDEPGALEATKRATVTVAQPKSIPRSRKKAKRRNARMVEGS